MNPLTHAILIGRWAKLALTFPKELIPMSDSPTAVNPLDLIKLLVSVPPEIQHKVLDLLGDKQVQALIGRGLDLADRLVPR